MSLTTAEYRSNGSRVGRVVATRQGSLIINSIGGPVLADEECVAFDFGGREVSLWYPVGSLDVAEEPQVCGYCRVPRRQGADCVTPGCPDSEAALTAEMEVEHAAG